MTLGRGTVLLMTTPAVSEAAALADLAAHPGINWRPFGRDDLPAIADFYAECEAHDRNPERQSRGDLQEFWDAPRPRPESDTLVGDDPGER